MVTGLSEFRHGEERLTYEDNFGGGIRDHDDPAG
jgi:hypothetical protein